MNIQTKLEHLEAELVKGREYLQKLGQELNTTQATVCRIEGAIQCCKDLMTPEGVDLPPPADVAASSRNGIEVME